MTTTLTIQAARTMVRRALRLGALAVSFVAGQAWAEGEVYRDAKAAPAARTEDLLQRLTSEEKLDYIGGIDSMYIKDIPRLGIPRIKMSDGPLGCRCWGKSTAYPAGICIAATWNPDVARQAGVALGRDCRARGVHILLAPGVNIYREAQCGRNFEYAGEDPYLAGAMVSSLIQGLQSQGVLGTIKHYACNNQEHDRGGVSAEIDERTLREIYLPAFKAAVQQGKVGCLMDAYNKVNGSHCTENVFLNIQMLRQEWGFTGIVMSDWGATHDAVAAANGGLDLEMPDGAFMNAKNLQPAIKDGRVTQATIDDKVRHILYTIIAAGFLDRPQELKDIPADDPTSAQVALEAARQGVVLLQNRGGLLPLDAAKLKSIAVIGPNSHPAVWGGGGSSYTTPFHSVSVLDGIRQAAPGLTVTQGGGMVDLDGALKSATYDGPVTLELFDNKDLKGKPVVTRTVDRIEMDPKDKPPADGMARTNYSARWTARIKPTYTGTHVFAAESDDGVRVILDGKTIINDWNDHGVSAADAVVDLTAGKECELRVEWYQNQGEAVLRFGWGAVRNDEAIAAAKQADVAVVCVGFLPRLESEGSDRTYALPKGQAELIRDVAAANPRTVVVLNSGGGVDWQGWLEQVPVVLHAWYPGQEGGRAIAEILFGTVNPSGKIPATFEKRWEDNPSAPYYLREADKKARKAVYGEGIFVGYRGYDRNNVEPQFCFGYGLSYTTFEYADLAVTPATVTGDQSVTVSFAVRNTGARAGAEIAQLYVGDPECRVPRPPKELKGFARVELQPGETKQVTLTLGPDAMSFFDPDAKRWTVEPGVFNVLVGASSRDIRLKGSFAWGAAGGK